jgi:peptidoglycan/xylan/chitin deacetylase (PgdA/CDA1 family)
MHYVIIRDDDTNALTPVECLERLYRPFLDRGLPVNLAVIPEVATDTRTPDGELEGYLLRNHPEPAVATISGPPAVSQSERFSGAGDQDRVFIKRFKGSSVVQDGLVQPLTRSHRFVPIGEQSELTRYLLDNPLYHILQHGCHHEYLEFDALPRPEIAARLRQGTERLLEAGFPKPETFVAPYDRLSRESFTEVARRFRVLSTGWYELRRLPRPWWPNYVLKKLCGKAHWQIGGTMLLSHPGCMLSYIHPPDTILSRIKEYVESHRVTVLVTHWWEYFRNGQPDEPFIEVLHETARYLATHPDIKVVSFAQVAKGEVAPN